MIKVTRIVELQRKPIKGKKAYLIEYREKEVSTLGGFVEYVAPENMPKLNQEYESPRALENYCRGETS
jgi:hypothetical protein